MTMGNGAYIFVYFWSLIYMSLSSKLSSNMLIPCDKEGIIIKGMYNRYSDGVSVQLRLFQSLNLVHLNGTRLISVYSWINTKDMIIEKLFAEQQVIFLRGLASTFPSSMIIMITYMLASGEPLITLHVDNSSTVSQGKYGVFSSGWNGNILRPYANGTNFAMILGSKENLLSRWRKLCNLTKQKDTPDNITMSFFYDPNTYIFRCEIVTQIPMKYYLYLEGGGCKITWGKIVVSDQDGTTIGRVTNYGQCKSDEVKCVVMSPHGWERTLTPPTVHVFVTDVPVIDHISNRIGQRTRSRLGICFTVIFVCTLFLVLLLVILILRKRLESSTNIVNRTRARFHYFLLSRERTVTVDVQQISDT